MVESFMESNALFLLVCIDFYEGRVGSSFLIDVEY